MGLKFDPTISIGNLTAFAACIASVFFSWATLDKRLAAVEIYQQAAVVDRQKDDQHEARQDLQLRETVRDIDRKLEKIMDKITGVPK